MRLDELELQRIALSVAELAPVLGAIGDGQGVAFLNHAVEDDETGAEDHGVVVVRIEAVPGAAFDPSALLPEIVEVRPGHPLLGQKLGIVVGVEIVDVDLQAVGVDDVLVANLLALHQAAVVGQIVAVELVEEKIGVAPGTGGP